MMGAAVKQFAMALAAGVALALVAPQAVVAQENPREEAVRAVMVFNFLRFTEFPAVRSEDGRDIRLCVYVRGARQADALYELEGRRVGKRTLRVMDFSASQEDCQVLYVDTRQRWNGVAGHPRLANAMTISEYAGFAQEGGLIEVDVARDGVHFDINLGLGRRTGFHFAPELLRLARRIHE